MAIYKCPADTRQELAWQDSGDFGLWPPAQQMVAFTGYLGVDGVRGDVSNSPDSTLPSQTGILYYKSSTRFADISDGTANTFMVGERPPSADKEYGWWFAGAGWDGSGEGDVVLGAYADNYANALGCPTSKLGFQPGNIFTTCDQVHFWSLHTGGGNFLLGDGSVRFVSYSISNPTLQALCTRNGGEVIPDY
jgi:prepilin-type processing-associated H-X9-DG protein